MPLLSIRSHRRRSYTLHLKLDLHLHLQLHL